MDPQEGLEARGGGDREAEMKTIGYIWAELLKMAQKRIQWKL